MAFHSSLSSSFIIKTIVRYRATNEGHSEEKKASLALIVNYAGATFCAATEFIDGCSIKNVST